MHVILEHNVVLCCAVAVVVFVVSSRRYQLSTGTQKSTQLDVSGEHQVQPFLYFKLQ